MGRRGARYLRIFENQLAAKEIRHLGQAVRSGARLLVSTTKAYLESGWREDAGAKARATVLQQEENHFLHAGTSSEPFVPWRKHWFAECFQRHGGPYAPEVSGK